MVTNLAYGTASDGTTTYRAGFEFTSGIGTTVSSCTPSETVWCLQTPPAGNAKQWVNPTNLNVTQDSSFTRCTKAFATAVTGTNGVDYTECGYLYNWCAALGTASDSCNESTENTNVTDAGVGLCPTDWHLPTGDASGEFQTLHAAMGSATANWRPAGAWRGVYSGSFNPNYGMYNQGNYGLYWSATVFSSRNAYRLNFHRSAAYQVDNYFKYNGFAVRCILD
jgi:uncharacterized protein (TIGR02145 family)